MKTNLVDRNIYNFDSKKEEMSLDQIKDRMSEKLKYVLSDKD